MDLLDGLSGKAFRRDLVYLDVRVLEEQTQKLSADVSAAPDDTGPHRSPTSSAYSTTFAGMFTPVTSMLFLNSMV